VRALDPVRILLVDDQPANLFALEQVLASPDYELVKAQSGEAALAFLLRADCAVILLDVSMPGMDGYEVARLVRRGPRTREIPIVFVTAMAQGERDVLGGYESGAIDYLVKPVRPEVLRSKVAGFVALYRARQEIRRQAEQLREHERLEHRHAVAELELRALQRQQAAQRRYQTLVDGLSRAVAWILDPATLAPRLVGAAAAELLGVDRDGWSAAPRAWPELVHPDDRPRFLQTLAGLAPGGPAARVEHRMLGPGARTVWFETSVRLIAGDEPAQLELHGLSTDVSDAVQARDEAAFLARASAELAGSLDVESTMRTAARLLTPELCASCLVEAAPFGVAAAHEHAAREGAAQEVAAHLDLERLRARDATALVDPATLVRGGDGARALAALAPAAALVVPLACHGARLGTLCLLADDAARLDAAPRARVEEVGRRVAQALENAALHEQTRSAVLAREQFLSIASHELRTPLTALSLQSRMLAQTAARVVAPADLREELQRRVASVQRQVGRLAALTESVLDLTRIRTAGLRLELESCDLCEVVRDVVARFEETLRGEGRALTLRAPEPLPGRWDRTRLEQLVSNLVANAVKHGGQGDVAVTAEASGDRAVVTVSDNGPGIPEAEQARVFDAFAQGSRAAAGGLGLGLYIARSIAGAHGGRISLASAPGRGTSFRIELPRVADGEAAALTPVPAGSAAGP
jgi:signal transduction histidine kinase/DNA-binding response OmpR family regulator